MSPIVSGRAKPAQHAARGRISAGDTGDNTSECAGGRRATYAPSLRSVTFGSCYIYSPRGGNLICDVSRQVCLRLKLGDVAWLAAYAGLVRQEVTCHETLSGLFDRKTCLVPVPGSSPSPTGVWAAERLALALCGVGLGKSVWLGLRRHRPVRKSATASSADRPTVGQHMQSLSVACPTEPLPERLVLIDDVITRGRTILAAAARLHEALPHADIRAFALVRTMSFVSQLTHFLEPCQGVVRWAGGDARREP